MGGWWNTGGGTLLEATGVNRVQDCACTHMHCTHAHTRRQFFVANEQTQTHTHIFIKIISKALSLKLFEIEIFFHFCIVTANHRIPKSVEEPLKKMKKMEALAGLVIQSYFMSEHEMTVICG